MTNQEKSADTHRKKFVGFGFGPIQSGLMLLEAQSSGNFDRFVIAEIDQNLVNAVRRNRSKIFVNIARFDGIEKKLLTDIEIFNPRIAKDRKAIAAAIRDADELATAIPSVSLYGQGGESSVARLLAESIDTEKPRILYASENNNYAAEILQEQILKHCSKQKLRSFQILNTVIGKMSGMIHDISVINKLDLATMVPSNPYAVLVEEFNRILVSTIRLPNFERGIKVFEEKNDLLPFEEAKLFGHNAIHALLGYLAFGKGYRVMSEIRHDTELMKIGRKAFVDESGAALIRKHACIGEHLFTPTGYEAYADDLLERMTNPCLNDEVERVCRDPKRKLAYGDRLVGAMREALKQDVTPQIMARGATAALRYIAAKEVEIGANLDYPKNPDQLTDNHMRTMLEAIWKNETVDEYKDACIGLILQGNQELRG